MMRLVLIVGFLLIVVGMWFAIFYSPVQVHSDYSTSISVETPDKIENAISNVVSDLKRRDFVPVNLEVKWYPSTKLYVIYARGIDRTNLSKYKQEKN